MDQKYELTDNTITYKGHRLFQIRALKDIDDVAKAGELGGFVESMDNLSQENCCFVQGSAIVCGGARVMGDAIVAGHAIVDGPIAVRDYALVTDHARVYTEPQNGRHMDFVRPMDTVIRGLVKDHANIEGKISIHPGAIVSGHAKLEGDIVLAGDSLVNGNAVVSGTVLLAGGSAVTDNATVYGSRIKDRRASQMSMPRGTCLEDHARICGNAAVRDVWMSGESCIGWNAEVSGDAGKGLPVCLSGNARILGDAIVSSESSTRPVYLAGDATIQGCARVTGGVRMSGTSCIDGEAAVWDPVTLIDGTSIHGQDDYQSLHRYVDGFCMLKGSDGPVMTGFGGKTSMDILAAAAKNTKHPDFCLGKAKQLVDQFLERNTDDVFETAVSSMGRENGPGLEA